LATVNNTLGIKMSNQAQLQAQIDAINTALTILGVSLNRGDLTPAEVGAVRNQVAQLEQQKSQIQAQIQNLTVSGNPPDPQTPPATPGAADVGEVPVSAIDRSPGTPANDPQANTFVFDDNGELIPADSAQALDIIAQQTRVQNAVPGPVAGNFTISYNSESGLYDVVNLDNGDVVASNLTEQQAVLFAQDANTVGFDSAVIETVNRNIDEDEATARAAQIQALTEQQRAQQAISAWRNQASQGDWRVRLRLAPTSTYLYNDPAIQKGGILWPLRQSDGVIFPYTPTISTVYKANYSSYDLTHSNYRGFFYQNSYVEDIQLTAKFTAQDTNEADYLLAVIHFFRSVTKMFYGSDDAFRGAPPPMVFLQGLGEYQFNQQSCLVSQFNYNLPADVDYIRARSRNVNGNNFLQRRDRQSVPSNAFSGAWDRLSNANLNRGALNFPPAPPTLGTDSPTYVPTSMEIVLVLHPVQTREQVSKQFNMRDFANGNLLKGGFW
jgi:hypothetical protein